MVRVDRVDHLRDVFDSRPDVRVVAVLVPLRLIADAPDQNGRAVFVLFDDRLRGFELLVHLLGVGIAEVLVLMMQPQAGRHCQTKLLGDRHGRLELIFTPGTK